MAKIKQLPAHEAQKIAAGEVVERPANVVKELIENSLDAGATDITLYLEDGGRKLIRVVDNGYGMSPEDARLCIAHHATSKITTIHDLDHLHTFGFRGEALSSIASVSMMRLSTKQESDTTGITLDIQEGAIKEESITAMNTGTDTSIRNLFFNVPARQKFLKAKENEWRTIVHLFHGLCLAYQNVSFKLYHNERLIYTIRAASHLQERIGQLFEPAFAKHMLPIENSRERMNLRITGACTGPEYTRFDRSHIFVFVQNRWVKNYKLAQALIKGYHGMLQPNRYPAGVLFISLDQQSVDINIHPRKEEVQFLHPRIVEDLIEDTVQKALQDAHSLQISPSAPAPEPQRPLTELASPVLRKSSSMQPALHLNEQAPLAPTNYDKQSEQTQISNEDFLRILDTPLAPAQQKKTLQGAAEEHLPSLSQASYRLIGQLKLTYIVAETGEGLLLIDQHAAHERILYERIRSTFDDVAQIRLLFPQVIHLTAVDLNLLEPYLPLMNRFGIEAQRMSEQEIVITETPVLLKNQSLEDCIKQAVSVLHEYNYLEENELKNIIHERIHAQLSCKAAVKAGDELSSQSMHEIIKELAVTDNKLTCPHGRPTVWEMKSGDIEKKFKRDYR